MSYIPQTTGPIGSLGTQQPQPAKLVAPPYDSTEYDDKQQFSPGVGGSTPVFPAQPMVPRNTYSFTTPLASLQQGPSPVDCPACGGREMTRTEFVTGGTTHLAALLFCCVACLGCIPYCATWFKDVRQCCRRCGALLAVWHRSGRTEVMPVAHGARL